LMPLCIQRSIWRLLCQVHRDAQGRSWTGCLETTP
jgi:hypothetical protein